VTEQCPNITSASIAQDADNFPPGKVGEIARYIYAQSPYPNASIAIGAALALMSSICGRYINVSNSGLNIWIANAGGTGIGKEAAPSGISNIMSHVIKIVPNVTEFIGPSSLASPEAAHKRLARTPSVLVFIGELGIKLKIWCSPRASSVHAGLIAFFLDVFGKSGRGNMLGARENSDKEKGASLVHSPNLVLLGDTTESTLLEAMSEALIANGFLPRWIYVFAGDKRGPANKNRQLIPDDALVEWIASLAATSLSCQSSGKVYDIPLAPDAQIIDDEIEAFTSAQINNTQAEIPRQLWSRARLNVLKVAALVALGEPSPVFEIKATHMLWAKGFVYDGVEKLLSKVVNGESGEVAGNETRQLGDLTRVIGEYLVNGFDVASIYIKGDEHTLREMYRKQVFPLSYLQRRLFGLAAFKNDRIGATKSIERAINSLLLGDDIREMNCKQMVELFGCKPKAFVVANPHRFIGR